MAIELYAVERKKEISEAGWKHAIERAANYINRHPLKDITLFILLRSIDDEKFLRLTAEEAERFLSDLSERVSFRIRGEIKDKQACIIKYDPGGIIKECRNALAGSIERMGTADMDAIKEDLKKQNYPVEVIEIAIELRKLDAIKKNRTKPG